MELTHFGVICGLLLAFALVQGQKVPLKDRGEEFDKKLKNLTEENSLTAEYIFKSFFV